MKAASVLKRFPGLSANSFSACCQRRSSKVQVRYSATVGCVNYKVFSPALVQIRNLGLGPTSKDFEETAQISGPLTKAHATALVLQLKDDERTALYDALMGYQSNKIKEEYEGTVKID